MAEVRCFGTLEGIRGDKIVRRVFLSVDQNTLLTVAEKTWNIWLVSQQRIPYNNDSQVNTEAIIEIYPLEYSYHEETQCFEPFSRTVSRALAAKPVKYRWQGRGYGFIKV